MVLLIYLLVVFNASINSYLHSNMVLLISRDFRKKYYNEFEFTFQYGATYIIIEINDYSDTFLNLHSNMVLLIYVLPLLLVLCSRHLHSNMVLLISKASCLSILPIMLFTFQ